MTAQGSTSFMQAVHESAVVVQAHGELDVVGAAAFRQALREAVATDRPVVVVDLEHVRFLDSAALSVVFGTQRQLPVTQRLVLVNVPERMRRMLRLSAVDSVVEVHGPGEPQPWLDAAPSGVDPSPPPSPAR